MTTPETILSELIRCKTVFCEQGKPFPKDEFTKLHEVIAQRFPLVHSVLEREVTDGFTLIYRWKGGEGKPVLFMAHQDVVPASESGWKYPPFSGKIADGFVWGRGAFDMKCQLVAILQAAEVLIAQGFTPNRDVYLCFTHNEEAPDETGAKAAAKLLEEKGIRFAFAIDEGGYAFYGREFGMKKDGIFISLCEKGYADIEIEALDAGGHASTPNKDTALVRVCRAIAAIERNPPKPYKNPATTQLLSATKRSIPRCKGCGLVRRMSSNPATDALIRSTIAPTMIIASNAPNVLPSEVKANLNVRLLPGQTPEAVLAYCERTAKRTGVNMRLVKANNATKISRTSGYDYEKIKRALESALPNHLPVPGIMTGATDSRYFSGICDDIYRISPFACAKEVRDAMHGVNERISIKSLYEGISFFKTLIESF